MNIVRRATLLIAFVTVIAQPVSAQVASAEAATAAIPSATDAAAPDAYPPKTGRSLAEKAALIGGVVAAGVVAVQGLSGLFKKKAAVITLAIAPADHPVVATGVE